MRIISINFIDLLAILRFFVYKNIVARCSKQIDTQVKLLIDDAPLLFQRNPRTQEVTATNPVTFLVKSFLMSGNTLTKVRYSEVAVVRRLIGFQMALISVNGIFVVLRISSKITNSLECGWSETR